MLILGALALQLLVPTMVLLRDSPLPQRYGWQMFGTVSVLEVTATSATGEQLEVDLGRFLAKPRAEVDWAAVLPERMCERWPEAAEVTVRTSKDERTLACAG